MVTDEQFEELSNRVSHLARAMEAQTTALQAVAGGVQSLAEGQLGIGELGAALPRLQAFVAAMLLAYLHDQDVVTVEPFLAQVRAAAGGAEDGSGHAFFATLIAQVEKFAAEPEKRRSFAVILGGLSTPQPEG